MSIPITAPRWYDERLHQVASGGGMGLPAAKHTTRRLEAWPSSIARTQAWQNHPLGLTANDLASVFTDTTRVFDG